MKCKFEQNSPKLSKSLSTESTDLSEHQQGALNMKDINANKKAEWIALNEIVVDRGSTPYLSNLELYLNDYLITVVQGDGIIISTTTGSTAYAMAAGASMCHPSVPALIICPICPHSLSFRPIIIPAGVELRVSVLLAYILFY